MAGPLDGLKVVEFASIGPVPHAAMILGDLGADVIRIERQGVGKLGFVGLSRSRRSVTADLKSEAGRQKVLTLIAAADVVIEGFRPGVAERLGLGPADCELVNPDVIYARMTGWGQTGPMSRRAGHDINFLSLTGALHAMGRHDDKPFVPLNLIADFGGGSMLVLVGILAALWDRERSGRGQIIDAAMIDGVRVLLQMILAMHDRGEWLDQRESNLLDGGAPFYDTYACSDGEFVAVGALEPQFYAVLLQGLGLSAANLPEQLDRDGWPLLRRLFADTFASKSRDEWVHIFDETDACVTPVMSLAEASHHPQLIARSSQQFSSGRTESASAPRFSRSTPSAPKVHSDATIESVIREWC